MVFSASLCYRETLLQISPQADRGVTGGVSGGSWANSFFSMWTDGMVIIEHGLKQRQNSSL